MSLLIWGQSRKVDIPFLSFPFHSLSLFNLPSPFIPFSSVLFLYFFPLILLLPLLWIPVAFETFFLNHFYFPSIFLLSFPIFSLFSHSLFSTSSPFSPSLYHSFPFPLFPLSSYLFLPLPPNLRLSFASSQSKDYFSSLVNCCLVLSRFFSPFRPQQLTCFLSQVVFIPHLVSAFPYLISLGVFFYLYVKHFFLHIFTAPLINVFFFYL